jgi:uncharacterized membrane protein YtjA (UPF0391 family)
MLRMALVFLIVALIAGLLGSGLVAGVALDAARILFFVFIVLAILSFAVGYRAPPVT